LVAYDMIVARNRSSVGSVGIIRGRIALRADIFVMMVVLVRGLRPMLMVAGIVRMRGNEAAVRQHQDRDKKGGEHTAHRTVG
jgi:hypothetical protein